MNLQFAVIFFLLFEFDELGIDAIESLQTETSDFGRLITGIFNHLFEVAVITTDMRYFCKDLIQIFIHLVKIIRIITYT